MLIHQIYGEMSMTLNIISKLGQSCENMLVSIAHVHFHGVVHFTVSSALHVDHFWNVVERKSVKSVSPVVRNLAVSGPCSIEDVGHDTTVELEGDLP